MSPDVIGGLPARPLTSGDVRSLVTHPDIAICHPVYRLVDDDDAVVSVFLGIGDRFYVLVYDSNEGTWERVETVESWDGLTEDPDIDDAAIDDRLEATYDEDEIEPAGYLDDPLEGFAANLPTEPLTADRVAAIGERDFIAEAIPFTRRKRDDRYVTFFIAFDDPIESKRFFAGYGYDPDDGRWYVLDSLDATSADPDDETVFERLAETVAGWIDDRYPLDELDVDEESNPTRE